MYRPLSAHARRLAKRTTLVLALPLTLLAGCGAKAAPTSPPCDQKCQDGVALRGLRELMKFAYNTTVAGKPVGHQDAFARGLPSGTVHVFGDVTSNADQGLTVVTLLTYEISHGALTKVNDTPNQNYDLVFDGKIKQWGTIAVQPTAATSLTMTSPNGITLSGTVYDPPIPYSPLGDLVDAGPDDADLADADLADADPPDADPADVDSPDGATEIRCSLNVTQNGNNVSGKLCGRNAGFDF